MNISSLRCAVTFWSHGVRCEFVVSLSRSGVS